MSFDAFAAKHRYRFHRDFALQAFTPAQRYEHLHDALRRVSEMYPRPNVRGYAHVYAGTSVAVLPYDFYRGNAQQLRSILQPYQPYTFTASTEGLYYYGQYVPVSSTERGRYCVPLTAAASDTITYDIRYDAVHYIANDGIRLELTALPVDGDTVTINSTTFTFRNVPSATTDILIAATLHEQASNITDTIRAVLGVTLHVYEDDYDVYIRRVAVPTITYSLSTSGMNAVVIPSVNTVPASLEVDVFRWWSLYMLQAQYRYLVISHPDDIRQAESLRAMISHESEQLEQAYTSMGLHG